jgi:hypothetical protein
VKVLLALAASAFLLTLAAFANAAAPVANDDAYTFYQNSTSNFLHVEANDSPDARFADISVETGPQNGTYLINQPAGAVIYTPTPGYAGPDSFTYKLTLGLNVSNVATVTINVRTNLAPIAVDDFFTTEANSPTGIQNVRLNDLDLDGDTLLVLTMSTPGFGTLSNVTTDGNFNYTPVTDYQGPDSFTYTLSDGNLQSTGIVTLEVAPPDLPPVAVDDTSASIQEDAGATFIDVLANDTDPAGDQITIVAVGAAAHGTTSFTAGNVSYQPSANYFGPDSFTYTISDGVSTDDATVTVQINSVNDLSIANPDSASVNENSVVDINVATNDTDIDSGFRVFSVSLPAHGTAFPISPTQIRYTPTAGYSGPDSFTYQLLDFGGGTSNSALVSITVIPVNAAPSASNDSATVAEDAAATAINVLSNDSDPDGDALSVVGVGSASNGVATFTAGNVSYQPTSGYSGPDSFNYTISDGGLTSTATVSITVVEVNAAPVAMNDSTTVAEDAVITSINVLANDSDPNGNALSVVGVGAASKGVTSFTAGDVKYKPNLNANGSDSFTYTISDGALTATATVSVTISAVNDAPTARADAANVSRNYAASIAVLLNDSDVDGDTVAVKNFDAASNAGGKIRKLGNVLIFVPRNDFIGADFFNYVINDSKGLTSSARVNITVGMPPANDGFVNAIAINTAGSASVTGSNAFATWESGEQNHAPAGSLPSAQSAWWTWKSPLSTNTGVIGNVTITTAGSAFDTILAVYVKGSLPVKINTVVLKARNDNVGASKQSSVSFPVVRGTTYYIAVDGALVSGGQSNGAARVNVSFTPTGAG